MTGFGKITSFLAEAMKNCMKIYRVSRNNSIQNDQKTAIIIGKRLTDPAKETFGSVMTKAFRKSCKMSGR